MFKMQRGPFWDILCFMLLAPLFSFSYGALTAEEELEQLFQVTPAAHFMKRGAYGSIHEILLKAEKETQQKLNAEPILASYGKRFVNNNSAFRLHQLFLKTPEKAKEISRYNDIMENSMDTIVKRFAGRIPEAKIMSILSNKNPAISDEKRDVEDCPFPSSIRCSFSKYRTIDGSCNNRFNPLWGRSFTPFKRLIPPDYYKVGRPRMAKDGSELPSARLVSNKVYVEKKRLSNTASFLFMTFGQFIDHDMDLAAASKLKTEDGTEDIQCGQDGCDVSAHPACFPIIIPNNDPFFKQPCIPLIRSEGSPDIQCRMRTRRQLNVITPFIDASQVYGNTQDVADGLRDPVNTGAKLRVQIHPFDKSLKPLLPATNDPACRDVSEQIKCFVAGDGRVNEQHHLIILHTIFMREHNRLVDELRKINGKRWSEEQYYQEARKIVGAEIQHIAYKEFLPILLGDEIMKYVHIKLKSRGYFNGYDPDLNPQISSVFATAVYRFAHSNIPKFVKRPDRRFKLNGFPSLFMSETFFRPAPLYNTDEGGIDAYLRGFVAQKSEDSDVFFDNQITRHMFTDKPPHGPGMDLPAINTQRGRDHGLPGYTAYRRWCGLSSINNFEDLEKVMGAKLTNIFKQLYKHVDDIDIYAAGMAEKQISGGMVGETFACLLAEEFSNIRHADRFWYERSGSQGFTKYQLQEIRKMSMAKIFCNNGDSINRMPLELMKVYHPRNNQAVNCRKIPDINLKYWKHSNHRSNYDRGHRNRRYDSDSR